MKRSFAVPVALLALVAVPVLAACGDETDPDALEVNGTTFSQSSVDDELNAISDNETFVDFVTEQGGEISSSEGTINSTVTANWLTQIVIGQVAADALADAGIEVTDADREEGRSQSEQVFGNAENFDAFDTSFQDDVVDRNAALVAFDQAAAAGDLDLSDDVIDDAIAQAKDACESGRFVSHILVETQAEADVLALELAGGADFGDVAQESSTDGSAAQGGALGCYEAGTYVQEFADAVEAAELDEVTQPVQSEFGFHLILVSDEPPVAQVTADALGLLVRTADVSVEPRYGSWDGENGQVVPPEPAVPPTS